MGRLQCRECQSNNIIHDGDTVACGDCGSVLEQSQIVSEVTFGETSSGAATVQGSYVGADQAGARISGPGGFRGSSAGESRQQTLANALQNIRKMANIWNLSESVILMAHRVFTLAMVGGGEWLREHSDPSNFVLGRKSDITVASCLYLACRYENRPLMLIDFADSIGENVFTLGRSYLKLTRMIHMKPPRGVDGASTIVDPSIYIQRFAIMLDFGDEAPKVTSDALRLIKRFTADWMVQGRRPAGICAAALILAARMNHFRRSIAEVVQVARIADVTLRKRLDEFAKTESSKLSVADFRSLWLENAQDPPAFYEPLEADKSKKKKKRKREPADEEEEDGEEAVVGPGSGRKRKQTRKGKQNANDEAENADDEGDEEDVNEGGADAEKDLNPQDRTDDQPMARDGYPGDTSDLEEPETFEQAQQRQRQAEMEAEFDRLAESDVAELLNRPELRSTAEELETLEAARIARARALPSAAIKEISMDDIDPRLRSIDTNEADAAPQPSSTELAPPPQREADADVGVEPTQGQEKSAAANDDGGEAAAEEDGAQRPSGSQSRRDGEADAISGRADEDDHDSIGSDSSVEDLDPTRIYFPRVRKRSMSAPIMPEDELVGLDEEELDMYIATDAEIKIKERVWVEFNRDYLERELNKQLKIELLEKQGLPAVKREQRKRKPRDSSTPMARTAAEATQKMMQQNKKFSRKLNYDILNSMFDQKPSASGSSKQKGKDRSGSSSSRRQKEAVDEDEDDDDDDDDDADKDDDPIYEIDGIAVDRSGGVADIAAPSSSRRKSKSQARSRSRRSSTGGRSSGAETDGATTDGGDAVDPMAAEYRRMVRGNFQQEEGGYADEW
ncbi:hypothetical protein CF319_g1075 [Tilletia indica]|nr:hypothetical protein CF319_g1075 [Tilletia indica]